MTDLNTLISASTGWNLSNALSINNQGQIAGSALDADSNQRAFVLSVVG
jgi:hypothetical protein